MGLAERAFAPHVFETLSEAAAFTVTQAADAA